MNVVSNSGSNGMDTGIFIRAFISANTDIGGRMESVDIGDSRLRADQLLEWLLSKDDTFILRVMNICRERGYDVIKNGGDSGDDE
jgi:hypothetical protein